MKKILVVDDAAFMRLLVRSILERNGFEIVGEATNGLEGVQKYEDLKPDVVTMDITMPTMTGIEAVKAIRKMDSKARVIMISAMGQESMVREAVISGARSFIVKPFKEEQLVNTINKILEN